MITDYYERMDRLRERLEKIQYPVPYALIGEVNATNQALVCDTISLMLDVIEDCHFLESVLAFEKKVGIDNSEDPESIDYRVRQLERVTILGRPW